VAAPGGPGDAPVNERPTFTAPPTGKDRAMDAARSNRRLLIALAAIGVVAGLVGIGASITEAERSETDQANTEAERSETDQANTEAEAAVSRTEAEAIATAQVAGPVDRSRISADGGSLVWEVRIDADSGHTDVLVDATTGAVLDIDD
jgi:uncharacterized membrane protein YkoI